MANLKNLFSLNLEKYEKITGIYFLFGQSWITLGDWWFQPHEGHLFHSVQFLKGTLFILVTTLLLYLLLRRNYRNMDREKDKLSHLIEKLPDGVMLLGDDGEIMHANSASLELLETFHDASNIQNLKEIGGRSLSEWRESDQVRWKIIKSPGEVKRYCEATILDFNDVASLEEQRLLILRDITWRKQIEARSQQQERMAALGQLAAGIAHDFNNLLQAILGYTELLQRKNELGKAAQRELDIIYHQGEIAAQMVEQIKDFCRHSRSEKIQLQLLSLIKSMSQLYKRSLPTNIGIQIDYDPDIESAIFANPVKIIQVITNLIINARDAIDGQGRIDINLEIVSHLPPSLSKAKKANHPWVCLEVSDTGKGIKKENLKRIFEPFFTTKEGKEGTGLGLSQVYGIIEEHKGKIEVESKVGEGTTFRIYFPQPQELKSGREEWSQSMAEKIPFGRGEQILVVEDNLQVLLTIQGMLNHLGYQVRGAQGGREALAIFKEFTEEIDLLLCDAILPDIPGDEVVARILEKNDSLPILLMTGNPALKIQRDYPVLDKPLKLKELGQALHEKLHNPHSQAGNS